VLSHLDQQIGRLISHLKATGEYENTLIIFTSDNGPAYQGSPGPFKGGKTDLHEGGIRVPTFFVWPGKIKAHNHTFQAGHFADIFPTIGEIAKIKTKLPDDLDGISLLPVLQGRTMEERVLLWQMDLYKSFQNQGEKPKPYATSVAIRGNMKLLADSLQPIELFDLAQDHREIYNILGESKELTNELQKAIKEYHAAPRLECCEN